MLNLIASRPEIVTSIKGVIQAGVGKEAGETDYWMSKGYNQLYFEPLQSSFEHLQSKLVTNYAGIKNVRAFNVALGDHSSKKPFYVTTDLDSSSLLPLNASRPKKVGNMQQSNTIVVDVVTLDTFMILHPEIRPLDYNLLFMDTQCTEDKVLDGAVETLKNIDYVTAEVAYVQVYEGSITYDQFIRKMDYLGYRVLATLNIPQYEDIAQEILFGRKDK